VSGKVKLKPAIKDWPEEDRPREKLLAKGAGALSNSELLAILLRTGAKGVSAIELGRALIEKFGTFREMSHTDMRNWKAFKGLGPAKIAQIQAALEIGRRFRDVELRAAKQKVMCARDVAGALIPQMRDLKTEVFKVVYLDGAHRIIEICDAAVGTVHHALPIVREILHAALQKYAVSMICAHNHPSGHLTPSQEDRDITKTLVEAGKLLQIRLLDHLIIGDGRYFSFADEGLL